MVKSGSTPALFCCGVMSGIDAFSEIEKLLQPVLSDLGYDLVVARMIGGSKRTLQVMAEPVDHRRSMTVEDCVEISHALSAVLDVEDPIPGRYTLEVSSPGLDRPLVRKADFVRFVGHGIRVETGTPVNGRRRFKGELLALVGDGGQLRLNCEDGVVELPLSDVRKARLEMSEDLIRKAGKARKPDPVVSREDDGR